MRSNIFRSASAERTHPAKQQQSAPHAPRHTAVQHARGGETAVLMQSEMWVMSASTFVELPKLRPHQELLAEGKLLRWDRSMTSVFFLSHQWTSFSHPDHTNAQLRTFQTLLLRMMRGEVPDTASEDLVHASEDTTGPMSKIKITSEEWQRLVPSSYVWMDFISVPQLFFSYVPVDAEGEADQRTELMKAINSIPAFVERCTHFFTLCPTVQHKELREITCDYATWLTRGWW